MWDAPSRRCGALCVTGVRAGRGYAARRRQVVHREVYQSRETTSTRKRRDYAGKKSRTKDRGPRTDEDPANRPVLSESVVSLSFGFVFRFVFVRPWPLAFRPLSGWTLQSSCKCGHPEFFELG